MKVFLCVGLIQRCGRSRIFSTPTFPLNSGRGGNETNLKNTSKHTQTLVYHQQNSSLNKRMNSIVMIGLMLTILFSLFSNAFSYVSVFFDDFLSLLILPLMLYHSLSINRKESLTTQLGSFFLFLPGRQTAQRR